MARHGVTIVLAGLLTTFGALGALSAATPDHPSALCGGDDDEKKDPNPSALCGGDDDEKKDPNPSALCGGDDDEKKDPNPSASCGGDDEKKDLNASMATPSTLQ